MCACACVRLWLPSASSSVCHVYGDDEADGECCAAAQQSLENSITMSKMKLLKAKMEDMNLSKKVRGTSRALPMGAEGL